MTGEQAEALQQRTAGEAGARSLHVGQLPLCAQLQRCEELGNTLGSRKEEPRYEGTTKSPPKPPRDPCAHKQHQHSIQESEQLRCVNGRLPASKGSLTEHAIVQAGAMMLSSYAASTRSVHVQLHSTLASSIFLYLTWAAFLGLQS